MYSFAVAGPGGFAAYSTEVTRSSPHVQGRIRQLQFVALRQAPPVGVTPASVEDFPVFFQAPGQPQPDPVLIQPGVGGGPGGGFGGGGGGLLGALAGTGIGAGIGAALPHHNHHGPATPAVP